MKRRTFLYESSLIAFSIGVAGKIKWNGHAYVGENATTTDILGPYYRPGAPFKTDIVRPGTKGEVLHFGGTIFEKDDYFSPQYLVRAAFLYENMGKPKDAIEVYKLIKEKYPQYKEVDIDKYLGKLGDIE